MILAPGAGVTSALDPVKFRAMIKAFDQACRALPTQPVPEEARDVLADVIVELADDGERDIIRLRNGALAVLKSMPSAATAVG